MPDSKNDSLRALFLKAGSSLTLIPDEVWEAYHEKNSEDGNNKPQRLKTKAINPINDKPWTVFVPPLVVIS